MSGAGARGAQPAVDLAVSRRRIDEIDRQIVDLFEQRMRVVSDVADYKRATGKAVYDRERERQKVAQAVEWADEEYARFIPPLFELIMELSRSSQHTLLQDGGCPDLRVADAAHRGDLPQGARVCCQGVEGAYSHIAACEIVADPAVSFCASWSDVCDAVEAGDADFGVLPLENSTAGTVNRVYGLLSERGLYIASSLTLRIDHNLLAKPGCRLADVREVYSHEQALRQCEDFIASLPGGVRASVADNTAMAARAVAESDCNDVAAISSSKCAELYGLDVLAHAVQDEKDNFTRFICVARDPWLVAGAERSSFLLVLPHEPGSLYRVLARIAALDVNMLKLESRPIPGKRFEFMFYVDVASVPGDDAFSELVSQVAPLCDRFCYLGSYREQSR